jgi:hypothetical protein
MRDLGRAALWRGRSLRYGGAVALLLEVVGVVAGVWILTRVIRSYVPGLEPFAVAAVAFPAVVGTLLAASSLWPAITNLDQQATAARVYTPADAAQGGAPAAGANPVFLTWAANYIPAHDTYYLVAQNLTGGIGYWTSYQLLPRRAVRSPRDAHWLILYNLPRSAAGPAGQLFGPETVFGPNFGIARRS